MRVLYRVCVGARVEWLTLRVGVGNGSEGDPTFSVAVASVCHSTSAPVFCVCPRILPVGSDCAALALMLHSRLLMQLRERRMCKVYTEPSGSKPWFAVGETCVRNYAEATVPGIESDE